MWIKVSVAQNKDSIHFVTSGHFLNERCFKINNLKNIKIVVLFTDNIWWQFHLGRSTFYDNKPQAI